MCIYLINKEKGAQMIWNRGDEISFGKFVELTIIFAMEESQEQGFL